MSFRYIINQISAVSADHTEFPLLRGLDGDLYYEDKGVSWPRVIRFCDGAEEPLFLAGILSSAEISTITDTIARELVDLFHGQKVLLVELLEGAIPFCEMLCENLAQYPVEDFQYDLASIKVSSYLDGMRARSHQVSQPLHCNGKEISTLQHYDQVVILDDLIDAGNTITWLIEKYLPVFKPKQLSAYFMLEKDRKRQSKIDRALDGVGVVCGKKVPDEWVVGYGLDIRVPGGKGQKALHLFRSRLPGGIYAFNATIEKKLIVEYQKESQQVLQQLQIFSSGL